MLKLVFMHKRGWEIFLLLFLNSKSARKQWESKINYYMETRNKNQANSLIDNSKSFQVITNTLY